MINKMSGDAEFPNNLFVLTTVVPYLTLVFALGLTCLVVGTVSRAIRRNP